MRRIFHEPHLQEIFEKNGYVVIDFINPESIIEINKAYNTLMPDDGFKPRNSRYHCTFVDTNIEYKKKVNQLFRQYFDSLLDKTLIDYELLTGNLYVKQPGCGEFEVHQNWDLVDQKLHTALTIWVPLQDTDSHNGTIEVVAGSNKINSNISTLHSGYFFRNFEAALKKKYLQPVDLKMGQAIIFDDNLIHYSKGNSSDKPRKAIQLECMPKEAELIFYYVDPANTKYIEKYEAHSNFFLTHNIGNVIGRPPLKYIGRIPNQNVFLAEEEFVHLLNEGAEIRKSLYGNAAKEKVLPD